uniref:Uncharacterized protein n=1 Tax=uncultured prokaryote TaxID=198431 RepID=A0A0H5QM41_9ZZZZ|nr:hypothetical protein [uncultured prokaryote]
MITHLTLTVQLSQADVAWHLHQRLQTDDGADPASAIAGGRLPLVYGEADDLDAHAVLCYVLANWMTPQQREMLTDHPDQTQASPGV